MATFPKANTMSQSILGAMETIPEETKNQKAAAFAKAGDDDVYKAMQAAAGDKANA